MANTITIDLGREIGFELGSEVYLIKFCNTEKYSLNCPVCNGYRTVDMTAKDGNTYKIKCPRCEKNKSNIEVQFSVAKATTGTVVDVQTCIGKHNGHWDGNLFPEDKGVRFGIACDYRYGKQYAREWFVLPLKEYDERVIADISSVTDEMIAEIAESAICNITYTQYIFLNKKVAEQVARKVNKATKKRIEKTNAEHGSAITIKGITNI